MLLPLPESAKYVHDAHALAPADVDSLVAAGRVALGGDRTGAAARVAAVGRSRARALRDEATPLDVAVVTRVRARLLGLLGRSPSLARRSELGATLATLSLAAHEVSARAEQHLASRALRLERLVEIDAPQMILDAEVNYLLEALLALDRLDHGERTAARDAIEDGEAHVSVQDAIVLCARRTMSLGLHSRTYDAVMDFLEPKPKRRARPPFLWELAPGEPMLPLPDLSEPPAALFERAVLARGVWDEAVERQTLEEELRAFREWRRCDEPGALAALLREACNALAGITTRERRRLSRDIPCAFEDLVPCDDFVSVLAGVLDACARSADLADREGLVLLSRVDRSLAW